MGEYKQKAYGAYAKDEEIRRDSSSGGIFTALARKVLLSGGVVWGAALDAQCGVVYQMAETEAELAALRGSKYVFLPVGKLSDQVQPELVAGRQVLIVVSPCQAGLLRRQLGNPQNLILVDFVCHGAPDPAVWRQYWTEAGEPVSVCFRRKEGAWTDYRFEMIFANGKMLRVKPGEDPYFQAFMENLSLREACTVCPAKGGNRESDLTLGDFWGVSKVCPGIYEKSGTSLVLIHSPKGEALWEKAAGAVCRQEVPLDKAVKFNAAAIRPSPKGKNWTAYQAGLSDHTLAELAALYGGGTERGGWKAGLHRLADHFRR